MALALGQKCFKLFELFSLRSAEGGRRPVLVGKVLVEDVTGPEKAELLKEFPTHSFKSLERLGAGRWHGRQMSLLSSEDGTCKTVMASALGQKHIERFKLFPVRSADVGRRPVLVRKVATFPPLNVLYGEHSLTQSCRGRRQAALEDGGLRPVFVGKVLVENVQRCVVHNKEI